MAADPEYHPDVYLHAIAAMSDALHAHKIPNKQAVAALRQMTSIFAKHSGQPVFWDLAFLRAIYSLDSVPVYKPKSRFRRLFQR